MKCDDSIIDCQREAVDLAQECLTEIGYRPFRVFLIKTKWSGGEREFGIQAVISEEELLPRPRIEGWSDMSIDFDDSGRREGGTIIAQVSSRYSHEDLMPSVEKDEAFFWEIEHADKPGVKRRFFPSNVSELDPGKTRRVVVLTRSFEDRDKEGRVPDFTRLLNPPKA